MPGSEKAPEGQSLARVELRTHGPAKVSSNMAGKSHGGFCCWEKHKTKWGIVACDFPIFQTFTMELLIVLDDDSL